MKLPGTRSLLLGMGAMSALAYLVELGMGHTHDELLLFAGSMVTTYALTERHDDDDNKKDPPPGQSGKRSSGDGGSRKGGSRRKKESRS